MFGSASDAPSRGRRVAILVVLSFLAYAPCVDNGFISDDYVVLEHGQKLLSSPLALFASPPEGFRTTSYGVFAALRLLVGYHPEFFYIVAVLLHALNALLLGRLVFQLTRRDGLSFLAAALFAVVQNPSESVMWASAINESLLGAFALGCLLCWSRKQYVLASLWCVCAWLSKESAVMIVPLVAALEWMAPELRPAPLRKYAYLLVPSAFFAAVLALTLPENPLFTKGFYAPGWRFALVEINSLHRLLFPWVYLVAAIVLVARRVAFPVRAVISTVLLMAIALAPYAFLTYQGHIPSRQLHVASMGLAVVLACLLCALVPLRKLAGALALTLMLANVGYIWFVKDAQFERRARPTNELLASFRSQSPRRVNLEGFPENPWIAKLTTRLAPGWSPELALVPGADAPCAECETWLWSEADGIVVRTGPTSFSDRAKGESVEKVSR